MFNNDGSNNEIEFKFTAGAGADPVTPVYVFPGSNDVSKQTLGTDIAYTGPYGSWANFMEYVKRNNLVIKGFRIISSDGANFNNTVVFTKQNPADPSVPAQKKTLQLADEKKSDGSSVSDTCKVVFLPQDYFEAESDTTMAVHVNQSTNIRLFLIVAAVNGKTVSF